MHQSSMELMQKLLSSLPDGGTVLDCGSAIADTGLQKSYRGMCEAKGLTYVGFDAKVGKNVDLTGDICNYWFPPQDLVISGQMLEHLEMPVLAVQNMKQAVRIGGYIILIAPWSYGEHRYPIDCWRVFPDGMRFLLEGFEEVDVGTRGKDCWGMARRPAGYKRPWIISRS